MEILASNYFLTLSPLSIKSFPVKNPNFFFSAHRKPLRRSKFIPISCSISTNFNGWDDLSLLEDSGSRLIDLNPVRRFLISSGLDDPKLAFTFCIGFVSALAVSRVRFSSMVVLLVSIVVFVVGFSAGAARVRVSDKKVRDLESFLQELVRELEKGADSSLDQLDRSKIKSLIEGIECLKKNVEGSIFGGILNGYLDFDLGGIQRGNPKSSKKRKEVDLIQYLGDLFQENVFGFRAPKVKGNPKGDSSEQLNAALKTKTVILGSEKENAFSNVYGNQEHVRAEESELLFNENIGKLKEEDKDKVKAIKVVSRHEGPARNVAGSMNDRKFYRSSQETYDSDMFSYKEELNNLNRNFRFMTKQESFERRVLKHNYEHRSMQRDIGHYVRSGTDKRVSESLDFFPAESEAPSSSEEALHTSNGTYDPLERSRTEGSPIKEPGVKFEEHSVKGTQFEEGNVSYSSTTSVNVQFNQYMEEATNLLKQARECMKIQADEGTADSILYKSAKLLSAAEAMRPMSLLAVGQLGNTFLLHGELKLKISRELRTLLLRSDAPLNGKGHVSQFKNLNIRDTSREDVENTLVEVCEECEELLVGAGRKYRTALSIDGNDVRALYNWGLALSFRAQLIADIGPEAALDADKIYLAAIDKFDAMMSRSNLYAKDALYRWGLVLRQRSYLRPRNNREKTKLLHQAKSLFEDVLSMESDNLMVREALVSCISELDYNGQW